MKKLLSLILTGVIAVGMVGCRRDITKPLTDAEQTLVDKWSGIEEDLNSCNVSSIEDTIEDLDEQVELLEEEQDYFKNDDTEYKAIDELIDVFETANKVLEISVNFIKNPMSALVVGDTIEQQIEGYGDEIQDSLEKYKEYKKELGIVTNVDLSKIGNQEDNTKKNKNEGTTDNLSNTTQSTNDNSSNTSNKINVNKSNDTSKKNTTINNNNNECIHKCPNCGEQMEELYSGNYYCTNPNCVSYTDPNGNSNNKKSTIDFTDDDGEDIIDSTYDTDDDSGEVYYDEETENGDGFVKQGTSLEENNPCPDEEIEIEEDYRELE